MPSPIRWRSVSQAECIPSNRNSKYVISCGLILPNAGTDVDDDELERELEALEQEELDKELLGVGPSASADLPEVPSDELRDKTKAKEKKTVPIAAGVDEDDEDMKQMLAWAN